MLNRYMISAREYPLIKRVRGCSQGVFKNSNKQRMVSDDEAEEWVTLERECRV